MNLPIHARAVHWAMEEEQNNVHEIPPHSNKGPRVSYYQTFDFLQGGGYPWCVCFFLAAWANVGHPLPYPTPGSHALGDWAVKNKWSVADIAHLVPGDGIDFNIGSGHWGMYLDHTKTKVEVVNGNVGDRVQVSSWPRSDIRRMMHVPEIVNIPPKKPPLYVITTSVNGHSKVIVTQRTWKMIEKVLPKVVKNRGWNGFTVKRTR